MPDANALVPPAPPPGAPVFAEPWHARVLALADSLVRAGLFSAGDWSAALGQALRRPEATGPDAYYVAALAALETLAARCAAITDDMLDARIAAWRRAELADHSQS